MAGQNREFEGKFLFLDDILHFWCVFEDICQFQGNFGGNSAFSGETLFGLGVCLMATHLISAPALALQASLAMSDSDTAALQCFTTEILTDKDRAGRRSRRRVVGRV